MDKERLQAAVREILLAVGENPDRPGLVETPRRVADMYAESLLLRQKVSRIFLGTFSFGLQLLTRERRELYRPSFCAALPHFPNKSRKSRHRCAGKAKISR